MNALSKMSVRSLTSLFLSVTLLSGAALAQAPDRVGRIAHVTGDVQFYSESAQAWLPAQLNAPVSSRNSLYTGPDSRAEIRFGSSAVSLDAETQLDIQALDDSSFKAAVPRGSVSLRVREIEGDETYEVSAPAASYTVLQAGRYRVDAADNGSGSSVSVLAGLVNAAVAGDGSAMVEAGQALSAANGGFERSSARRSGLDRWAEQRDNAYRSSQSARYVSPNMTGYEELDTNGRWASDPDYGNVWYPTTHVSVDWVPYRDGRWAYVAPWGWTWIDAAPWGFAPFHYGRWVLIGPRWAWMPGAYVRRPSYAPALVGFIGGSTAVSISIGARPAVGWYPLPPWEQYRPAYAHHDRHSRNINNFSISKPPSHAWRTVDHKRVSVNQVQGATVVPREAFVDSRPVRRAAISVSAPVLAAPHVAPTPVVAPTRPAATAGNGRPEFGDRRGSREPDQGRGERARGSAGTGLPTSVAPRPADAVAPATPAPAPAPPANADHRPGFSRGESRREERQVQPAIPVPQGRAPVAPPSLGSAPPVPSVPVANPEARPAFRDETRGPERRSQPVIVAPQISQPVPAPRVDSPSPAQSARPPASSPEPAAPLAPRRDEGRRGGAPAAGTEAVFPSRPQSAPPETVAPHQRAEPPAVRSEPRSEPRVERRVEPRVEPRVEQRPEPRVEPRAQPRVEPRPEPRPEPRVEPRVEPRAEPRQMQRVEPPPQREQKRAQEPERERRPHGEREKDKDKER